MSKKEVKYAVGRRGNRLVLITDPDIESGLKCGCICLHCEKPFVAVVNTVKKERHFRHYYEGCGASPESALHSYAKQVLRDHEKILLPEVRGPYGLIQEKKYWHYDSVQTEVWMHGIKPDIVLRNLDETLLVEIVVTNKPTESKLESLKNNCLEAIQIELDRGLVDAGKIVDLIIHRAWAKTWLFHAALFEAQRLKKIKDEQQRIKDEQFKQEQRLRVERQRQEKRLSEEADREYKRVLKQKWADEKWSYLRPRIENKFGTIPPFLDKQLDNEGVFACDRKIWQAYLFDRYIMGTNSFIVVDDVCNHLRTATQFPLAERDPNSEFSTLWHVVGHFFRNLEMNGFALETGHKKWTFVQAKSLRKNRPFQMEA